VLGSRPPFPNGSGRISAALIQVRTMANGSLTSDQHRQSSEINVSGCYQKLLPVPYSACQSRPTKRPSPPLGHARGLRVDAII